MLPRRALLTGAAAAIAGHAHGDEAGRVTIAVANISENPSVRLEGTGFIGTDVRESFVLAARRWPMELVFYDNGLDRAKAVANAQDAIRRRVDVYIHFGWDSGVNAEIGRLLAAAHVPVLAISRPVPGAPLYTSDNMA